MGISDFYNIIKEHCPEVLVTVSLSNLAGYSIAVDISIFLNKYVKSAGPERWIDSFIVLLCVLKKNGIKPVCIFDGPNPPPEKRMEQERRRAEAAKKQSRINHGQTLIKLLEEKYFPTGQLPDEDLIRQIKEVMGPRSKGVNNINYNDLQDIVNGLTESIRRQTIQNSPILPIYTTRAKEIVNIMGFPYFQADGEAEWLCAGMCHLGLVDAVLSEDTDVLAIGAPYLLSKLDIANETVVAISYQDILKSLEMTSDEFRDLCILLGCDYNDRIKGYPPDGKTHKKPVSIGAKGAYAMITEYRRLEKAEEHMEDASPLLYRRCRELFTPPESLPNIQIPYNKAIDFGELVNFLATNRVRISFDYITKACNPPELVYNSTDDEETEVIDW